MEQAFPTICRALTLDVFSGTATQDYSCGFETGDTATCPRRGGVAASAWCRDSCSTVGRQAADTDGMERTRVAWSDGPRCSGRNLRCTRRQAPCDRRWTPPPNDAPVSISSSEPSTDVSSRHRCLLSSRQMSYETIPLMPDCLQRAWPIQIAVERRKDCMERHQ